MCIRDRFSGKTVILAFDPPSEENLNLSYQEFFNQTLNSWSTIKGDWQIINSELYGGEIGKYGEGIILSQVSAQNFIASFKVKPTSGNATVLNYVSLVYSWFDSKNYRIADILFNADGYIYVLFRTILDGVEKVIPNWPGVKTDLKWDFGKEYNITVSVNGTLNQISINDKPYLSIELENIPGRIGLRYYKLYQTVFDDFTINYEVKLNMRAVDNYLDFLKSGGEIIVLNTNGYNFFGNNLFTLTGSTIKAKEIEGLNGKLILPAQIFVQKLILKNSTTSILSNYTGSNEENPYVIKQNYGRGVLFYVNVFPIAEALFKEENPQAFYPILGKLLNDLNLSKLDEHFLPTIDGYVKTIHLNGNSKVETSSLIFSPGITLKQLDIHTTNGSTTFYNVTSIQINGAYNLIIEAENFTIENGQGFYATLKINSTFTVKPSEGFFNLKIATGNEKFQNIHVEKLSITPYGAVNLLVKTPEISSSNTTFVEFYPTISLQWSTRTYGENLQVTGLTTFQIMLSDSYTILRNIKLGGSFTRDPPIVAYDELSTWPTAMFWTILLLPILFGATLIYTSRHPPRNKDEKLG